MIEKGKMYKGKPNTRYEEFRFIAVDTYTHPGWVRLLCISGPEYVGSFVNMHVEADNLVETWYSLLANQIAMGSIVRRNGENRRSMVTDRRGDVIDLVILDGPDAGDILCDVPVDAFHLV